MNTITELKLFIVIKTVMILELSYGKMSMFLACILFYRHVSTKDISHALGKFGLICKSFAELVVPYLHLYKQYVVHCTIYHDYTLALWQFLALSKYFWQILWCTICPFLYQLLLSHVWYGFLLFIESVVI